MIVNDHDITALISHDLKEKPYALLGGGDGISMKFKLSNIALLKQALQYYWENYYPGEVRVTSGLVADLKCVTGLFNDLNSFHNDGGKGLLVTLEFKLNDEKAKKANSDNFILQVVVWNLWNDSDPFYTSPEFPLDNLNDEPEVEYNFYQPTEKEIHVKFSITTKTEDEKIENVVKINDLVDQGMTGEWVKVIVGGQGVLSPIDTEYPRDLPLARDKWWLMLCEEVTMSGRENINTWGVSENISTWTVENEENSPIVYTAIDNSFFLEIVEWSNSN